MDWWMWIRVRRRMGRVRGEGYGDGEDEALLLSAFQSCVREEMDEGTNRFAAATLTGEE